MPGMEVPPCIGDGPGCPHCAGMGTGNRAYATDVLFEHQAFAARWIAWWCWRDFSQTPCCPSPAGALGRSHGQPVPLALNTASDRVWRASAIAWHACRDAEDEAQRTASCAIAHIRRRVGYPVALVSSDRALTRRVRSMLDSGARTDVRDENGWKLSTTHAGCAGHGPAARPRCGTHPVTPCWTGSSRRRRFAPAWPSWSNCAHPARPVQRLAACGPAGHCTVQKSAHVLPAMAMHVANAVR